MYEVAILQLRKNLDVFLNLIKNVSEEQRLWRKTEDAFSLHDILCHLYELEINYFRSQTDWLLSHSEQPLPEIQTQNWRYSKMYASKDYRITLRRFVIEREASVRWLLSIDETQWESSFLDPKLGKLSAKLFLMNWLESDYSELQKIIKLKYEYLNISSAQEQSLRFAGNF